MSQGYDVVIVVPVDSKARVMMGADVFFRFLDQETAKEASTETRIKDYRVKVEYDAVSEIEMKQKRDSVTKFVVDSAKKKKDKGPG